MAKMTSRTMTDMMTERVHFKGLKARSDLHDDFLALVVPLTSPNPLRARQAFVALLERERSAGLPVPSESLAQAAIKFFERYFPDPRSSSLA